MWTKGLLLGVVLLGLIAGGRSQPSSPPADPEPPVTTEPLIDPAPVPSCKSPESSTKPPGPKCNYYMVVPFKLSSGSDSVFCTWLKCAVPVTVTVSMEYYLEKRILFSKEHATEYFECVHFAVHKVEKQEAVYFTYSAVGNNVDVIDRKTAVINTRNLACLAQKNKQLYQQGEQIQLRLVCFEETLNQVVKNFKKITVVDPAGIRVFQDLSPTIENGVALFNFTTSDMSRLGYYSVQYEDEKGQVQYASVQVQEYDAPRFSWNSECPSSISVLEKTATISGKAEYVYGKPVPGTVVVRCCRNTPKYGRIANCFRGVDDICLEFTKELSETGKFTEPLNMNIFKLPFPGLDNHVLCKMTMKEDGTGIQVPSSCTMWITDKLAVLQLDRTTMGPFYNRINVLFAATLKDEKENPLAFKTITVQIDGVDVKYVTTDADGRAECVIDTTSYHNPNITLTAFYSPPDLCYNADNYGTSYSYSSRSYPFDEIVLFRLFSFSNSHVRLRSLPGELPCHQSHRVQVDYALTEGGVGKDATTANFNYIILSRNRIAAHGAISVNLSQGLKGSTYIEFYADYKVATTANVLVFVALKKDIISDTVTLNTGLCFNNEVNLTFTERIVAPGAIVEQIITAAPGSFCGLRTQDASLNLLNSYDEFRAYNVYSMVQSYIFGLNFEGVDYQDPAPPCINGNKEQFYNGMFVRPTSSRTDGECYKNFVDLSLLLFSNLVRRRPTVCGEETEPVYPKYYAFDGAPVAFRTNAAFAGGEASRESSINTVRSDFRDSFGFVIVFTDSNGKSIVSSGLPHTITEWESDAFCISGEKGIGLTLEPATVTAIQKFFVESSFPQYVVRGEEVIIGITIANYLKKCTQARAEVENSEHYKVSFLDDVGEQCACDQERASFRVSVTFSTIGKIEIRIKGATTKISDTCDGDNDNTLPSYSDTIILTIDVKAEGIEREATSTHLMTTRDGIAEVELPVSEPEDLVEDSMRCSINVIGDPVAISVKHFDKLLSTPSGCCDQMQAEVQAIIFLERYLKKFGELSEERSKKMLAKLSSGYMNMLSCRQYDGSYSRYRNVYEGDIWGTMLSLCTNHYLSDYIFIDESIQTQGLHSISRNQDQESGCLTTTTDWTIYQEHYNRDIQITAMAAPILRELSRNYSNAGPLIEGVDKCLHNVDFEGQNTLTQCYLLDAASSSGDWDTWHSYYSKLYEKAVNNGEMIFWKSDNSVRPDVYRYFPENSGDVLSTARVLISLTYYPNHDQELINQMTSITKWLSGKLTQNGGWFSPQATAAAIEGLTRFGSIINTGEPNAHVTIKRDGAEVFSVDIDKSNKFIVHSKELLPCYGDYKFIVNGMGSPVVQFAAFYSTKIATGADSAYRISAQASAPSCLGGVAMEINLNISFSFNGASGGVSTTLLTVEILTGYETNSFYYRQVPGVKEGNVQGRKAYFYIDTFDNNEFKFTMPIYHRTRAMTFQKAYVIAEEIYTGETGAAEYVYPCSDEPTEE